MKGLILAAGRGSRMAEKTTDQPKCLTVLAGKPLLRWQLDAMNAAGIQDVGIVTGYRAKLLTPYTQKAFYNARWADTNMVASLMQADDWLRKAECLISYSDIVFHPTIISHLMQTAGDVVITYDHQWRTLWQLRFEDPLSDAETFKLAPDGALLEIGQTPNSFDEIQGQYMGLLKITPMGWAQILHLLETLPPPQQDRLDMTSLLNALLKAGIAVQTLRVEGQWCEVDNSVDLARYEAQCRTEPGWTHDWRFD